MEEQLNSLAVTHLLQHTLRSLCLHENSQWIYAVFWRILPRNYPPPKWDSQGGAYDRSRGNRRNWILVWEDGFCNFAASTAESQGEHQHCQGLPPELFFKMSHEIYNYGEGLIGKVAADHGHKWIYKEQNDQGISFLSAWHNSADSHPRTWVAQFQSGLETIALIAVREGVIQLGAIHKVVEDLSYVVLLRNKFNYIESIPGVLLPHPSSTTHAHSTPPDAWNFQNNLLSPNGFSAHFPHQPMKITPSMSSLQALLSKLPSVVPAPSLVHFEAEDQCYLSAARPMEVVAVEKTAKKEWEDADRLEKVGESGGLMPPPHHHHHHHFAYHHDGNVSSSMNNNGC